MSRLPTFRHGVHPPGNKEATAHLPVRQAFFGSSFVLPLGQNLGAPARPVVRSGERVRRGQPLAEPGGFVSTWLHSPVTGRVASVDHARHPNGRLEPSITVEADLFDPQLVPVKEAVDWRSMSGPDFVQLVQRGGLVGLGGAAFPMHVKLSLPEGRRLRTLIVNGAECEPWLTCDHRVMVERPEAVMEGVHILATRLGVDETIIGIEANKPEAIRALRAAAAAHPAVRIAGLKVKYPQGAEKMLIHALTGEEVPAGGLPLDVGILVNNVSSMAALADWVLRGAALVDRVVTVAGPAVEEPANLLVPLGTPVRALLEACGGVPDDLALVVMGGPMMGQPLGSLDVPVLKGTSGILAYQERHLQPKEELACVRCGRCLEGCACHLNPSQLGRLARLERIKEMEQHHVMDCMECGACSYTCPSGIDLVHYFRLAKAEIRRRRAQPRAKEVAS